VLDQSTSLQTSLSSETTVSSEAGRFKTSEIWSFPFTADLTYPVSSDPFGYNQAFTQKYNKSKQVTFDGYPIYFNSLTNAVNATDVSPASSSQKYTFSDSDGVFHDCHIASKSAILTSVEKGCKQSGE
jgi:hypothetical protein